MRKVLLISSLVNITIKNTFKIFILWQYIFKKELALHARKVIWRNREISVHIENAQYFVFTATALEVKMGLFFNQSFRDGPFDIRGGFDFFEKNSSLRLGAKKK